jgi:hypothetical protein
MKGEDELSGTVTKCIRRTMREHSVRNKDFNERYPGCRSESDGSVRQNDVP